MKIVIPNKDDRLSIYRQLLFKNAPTISEVVKHMNWGGNKLIRQGGVRSESVAERRLWKRWDILKNPQSIIHNSTIIGTRKGMTCVVVWVESDCGWKECFDGKRLKDICAATGITVE